MEGDKNKFVFSLEFSFRWSINLSRFVVFQNHVRVGASEPKPVYGDPQWSWRQGKWFVDDSECAGGFV